jgi:hypothetical protein
MYNWLLYYQMVIDLWIDNVYALFGLKRGKKE